MNALLVAALENSGKFADVFVQPAAGNAGTALGAVLSTWHELLGHEERVVIENYCLGPAFTAHEIKQVVENCKLRAQYLLTGDELVHAAVDQLSDNKIVAWMQGRSSWPARFGQSQYSRFSARPLLHRKPQHLYQASRRLPQFRRRCRQNFSAKFRNRTQRALPRDGWQSPSGLSRNLRRSTPFRRSDPRTCGVP